MNAAVDTDKWWAALLRGIVAIAFGIIILVWPAATVYVLLVFFGAFALVDGLFALGESIAAMTRKEKWGWQLFKGLVAIFVGIVVLARPGAALLAVLYLIAIYLIVTGFMELAGAFEKEAPGGLKVLLVISGVLSAIIGVVLILVPSSGIVAIIWVVGIYAVVVGIIRVIVGFMLRKGGGAPDTPAVA